MNPKQRLFLTVVLISGASFVLASLFVIFYFRIFPNHIFWLFPIAFAVGVVFGILYYPPVRAFLEKKEEK